MEKKSWELTNEEKEKITEEQQQINLYRKFISEQQAQFLKVMKFVNDLINELKDNGKISEYTVLMARIKSPKSAMKNDNIKSLDDCFGMEIITATEYELDIIIQELSKFMTTQKKKDHDKDNGYKAKHKTMTFRKKDLDKIGIDKELYDMVPAIEYQFKTMEVAMKILTGEAEHIRYKGETKERIQELYDEDKITNLDVPIMWSNNGKGEMKMLTFGETLKKMYPFLKLDKEKEELRNINMLGDK